MYNFFYDETEHSRKINHKTITADNYCDDFISTIIGWQLSEEKSITERYLAFEEKYDFRKVDGELKSLTMKSKDFRIGFASLNKHTIDFYDDLISIFDEKIITYFSVNSKIEYVINQIFTNYHNNMYVDVDLMKYSIIKAINVYRPQKVIEAIYKEPQIFVDELRYFLENQIVKNQANIFLKEQENQAFTEILLILGNTEVPEILDWEYFSAFDGFNKLLSEMNILDYNLKIDREGDESHTLISAKYIGLQNVTEEDSKDYVGIRMADMLVGLISKLMQSLKNALTGDYKDGEIKKTLLDSGWFALNQRQLDMYKKLYKIICIDNNYWYKSYSGIYSDDLISFVTLLHFMNHFKDIEEVRRELDMQPEYYNAIVCQCLQKQYKIMRNKLPIDLIVDDGVEYFLNQKGAKVYKNINEQPTLPLLEGQNKYYVLSVGFFQNGVPLVTINENDKPVCYRMPNEYSEWAMAMVKMANMGERLFPKDICFSVINGKYYIDVKSL